MPSTAISDYHYDFVTGSLYVTYMGGNIYQYFDVPEATYNEMKASLSKGQYINYKIKGNYKFEEMG